MSKPFVRGWGSSFFNLSNFVEVTSIDLSMISKLLNLNLALILIFKPFRVVRGDFFNQNDNFII